MDRRPGWARRYRPLPLPFARRPRSPAAAWQTTMRPRRASGSCAGITVACTQGVPCLDVPHRGCASLEMLGMSCSLSQSSSPTRRCRVPAETAPKTITSRNAFRHLTLTLLLLLTLSPAFLAWRKGSSGSACRSSACRSCFPCPSTMEGEQREPSRRDRWSEDRARSSENAYRGLVLALHSVEEPDRCRPSPCRRSSVSSQEPISPQG
jgi:hypothetical protein